MIAEYKRDMNHNYLILTGDTEADTTSYPVRMLLGNIVPALLKCHLQSLDGKSLFYYEITSRQSLASFYENRLLGAEDLRFILNGFLLTMEKLEEYLLDPAQLVLNPDYIFLDLEKKELRFCYLPGYGKPADNQFRMLVEYLLPKLDHGDDHVVSLGYAIYRKVLEEHFQLEDIRRELYQAREVKRSDKEISVDGSASEGLPDFQREDQDQIFSGEFGGKNPDKKSSKRSEKLILLSGCALGVGIILVVLIAVQFGYLPQIRAEKILASVVAATGVGILFCYLVPRFLKKKGKKEEILDEELRSASLHRVLREKEIPEEFKAEKVWPEKESQKREETWIREEYGQRSCDDSQNPASEEQRIKKGTAWKAEAEECHETVILSMGKTEGPASLISREPGELATIYLKDELTVVGKMKTAADAVIPLPTVSRIHAKIRKKEEEYYLTDLNSRNGTAVNGRMLRGEEEYQLQNEDEVDFAQARYIFLK